ncbi:PH domain-containing protein [Quadrisphaera granulorum]|uniref:PH (Pleckstrin Homology) domain-containing protein n=1 Tax=Quadrisphaera granulorum TaxID=317664 RepID=A0A316A019_9ACTN|nr:PH domain-containing protein [Quadrisphaera granulorum]PWJ51181.1 PH (Pleckstrin Homology) domain-containing protein [Quadrisphaera granulorum]SZE97831.1 PH domain-containing protein [Quadrisphaera granulorum]
MTPPSASSSSSSFDDDDVARLHAPFRPVRGRLVARVLGVVAVVLFTVLALFVVGQTLWDRVAFVVTGLLVMAFCEMQARVVAIPDERGLYVRNLVNRRRLEWAEVVGVSFGGGRPWVQLDLADGDTLAVMGVQRSDGERGRVEADRLATLVALHSR